MFALRDANLYLGDFTQFSGTYFAGIQTLCSVSRTVFNLSIANLYANAFFNAKLLTKQAFHNLADEKVRLYRDVGVNIFTQAILELLELSTSNQLLSASSVSYNVRVTRNESARIEPAARVFSIRWDARKRGAFTPTTRQRIHSRSCRQ